MLLVPNVQYECMTTATHLEYNYALYILSKFFSLLASYNKTACLGYSRLHHTVMVIVIIGEAS